MGLFKKNHLFYFQVIPIHLLDNYFLGKTVQIKSNFAVGMSSFKGQYVFLDSLERLEIEWQMYKIDLAANIEIQTEILKSKIAKYYHQSPSIFDS